MVSTVQYHPKNLLLVFGNTFVSNGFTCMEKLYVVFLSYQFCPENCRNRQETVGITGTVQDNMVIYKVQNWVLSLQFLWRLWNLQPSTINNICLNP